MISVNINAYEISYIARDFVEIPNANASAPSVFWAEDCTTSMILYASATNTGSYALTHSYFSPSFTFIATNPKSRDNNINCQIQNSEALTSSNSANDFYEATTRTEYTSNTIDTWLNLSYDCSPDSNDLFIYNGTRRVDSYGNHPFGYGDAFTTCFAQSPAQCTNTLTSDLNTVMQYVTDGYFTLCGSDIRQDAEGEAFGDNSAGVQSDLSMNYWTMIPFNSESTGVVNISVLARVFYFSGAGSCGSGQQKDSQFYLWDIVENTTQNLGTGFPLDFNSNLVPNRDYWLLIGSRYYCDDFNFGILQINHNYTQYSITLNACETDFTCGNWSVCSSGIQTRLCTDQSDCNAPTRIEERGCFDTPEFDLSLGFEETIFTADGVYICTKEFVTCFDILSTIPSEYPVNWTVFPDFDGSGTARNNFVKMSSETASVGSKSLKMWYIPPKINEPVPVGVTSTVCGNGTTGSFPEVTHPYNESLFLSANITFLNPFPQIRYDVRKCAETVLQYDYTGDLLGFNCGKMCYASTCNETPRGRYGVRISLLEGQSITLFPEFAFFNDTGINGTDDVTDDDINTFSQFSSASPGATINSTENIFFNGTILNFTLNVTGGVIPICILDGATELTRFSVPSADTLFNFTIALGNISSPINEISLIQCTPPARTVRMRLFEIINQINITMTETLFDYVGFAPDTWDEGQIIHDLSGIGLIPGANYTISLSVNPENQFDPFTHCVYMDNFRVTFTELALPECISECETGSINRRIASLSNGICTFVIQSNSPDCIGNLIERERVENILLGDGGGEVTDNSTCIDSDNDGISDDLYVFDTQIGKSEIIIDSAACLLIISEAEEAAEKTEPIGDTQELFNIFSFIFSPMFLYLIGSIVISVGGTAVSKHWQIGAIIMSTMIFIGSIPAIGLIDIWVSIAIIAVTVVLISSKVTGKAFNIGGG